MIISNKPVKKTSIGGQALIEGLLMIGPKNAAIAVRKPDGEIVVEKRPLPAKGRISKIPVLRGIVSFGRQMVMGVKALMFSADFYDIEEEEKPEKEKKPNRIGEKIRNRFSGIGEKIDAFFERLMEGRMKDVMIYVSVTLSILFSIGLFILLPNFLAGLMPFNRDTWAGSVFYNLFEGAVRVTLFITYLVLASRLKEMKRVWQYHGAEHKTIHCYEAGEELTVENVMKYSTKHPRCGTSFLFIVMIVSILVFSLLPVFPSMLVNMLLRFLLVPLVAGISYEIIKLAGRSDRKIVRVISAPGLAFQRFTTREPDESQVEVAITAFNNVLVPEPDADRW